MQLLDQIQQDSINAASACINLPDGTRLHAAVDGRNPKCYMCDSDENWLHHIQGAESSSTKKSISVSRIPSVLAAAAAATIAEGNTTDAESIQNINTTNNHHQNTTNTTSRDTEQSATTKTNSSNNNNTKTTDNPTPATNEAKQQEKIDPLHGPFPDGIHAIT